MIAAGIDIGSRTTKLVVVEDGNIRDTRILPTGFQPMARAKEILEGIQADAVMATGYGRNLFEHHFGGATVTEIKAAARGAIACAPDVRTILDIGGQDVKVILVSPKGKVVKFEMNDRCAAGTGKFLEIMADSLGFDLAAFGNAALSARKQLTISAMCTVFAESEVTSLLARGESPTDIAGAVHDSVVKRAAAMVRRLMVAEAPVFFAGGVARNHAIQEHLSRILKTDMQVPESPQTVVALGAALLAEEMTTP